MDRYINIQVIEHMAVITHGSTTVEVSLKVIFFGYLHTAAPPGGLPFSNCIIHTLSVLIFLPFIAFPYFYLSVFSYSLASTFFLVHICRGNPNLICFPSTAYREIRINHTIQIIQFSNYIIQHLKRDISTRDCNYH